MRKDEPDWSCAPPASKAYRAALRVQKGEEVLGRLPLHPVDEDRKPDRKDLAVNKHPLCSGEPGHHKAQTLS